MADLLDLRDGFRAEPPMAPYADPVCSVALKVVAVLVVAILLLASGQLEGCGTVPDAFLAAERATYESLAPYVRQQTQAELQVLAALLAQEAGPDRRAVLERRVDLLEDHQRTLVLWGWALSEHEAAKAAREAGDE